MTSAAHPPSIPITTNRPAVEPSHPVGDPVASTNLSSGKPSITVVVPARNEEATVGMVVERSYEAFAELGRSGEVLVVNDGSTDGTAQGRRPGRTAARRAVRRAPFRPRVWPRSASAMP